MSTLRCLEATPGVYDETGRERTLNMDCTCLFPANCQRHATGTTYPVTKWEKLQGRASVSVSESEKGEERSSSQEKEKIILLAYPRSGSSFTGTGCLSNELSLAVGFFPIMV